MLPPASALSPAPPSERAGAQLSLPVQASSVWSAGSSTSPFSVSMHDPGMGGVQALVVRVHSRSVQPFLRTETLAASGAVVPQGKAAKQKRFFDLRAWVQTPGTQ